MLVGIVTNRDMRFVSDGHAPGSRHHDADAVGDGPGRRDAPSAALDLLRQHKVEKLPIVDRRRPAGRPDHGQGLRQERAVPASPPRTRPGGCGWPRRSGVGEESYKRARALVEAGVDALVVDSAHGHSRNVLEMVARLKHDVPEVDVIGGNVATYDGAPRAWSRRAPTR